MGMSWSEAPEHMYNIIALFFIFLKFIMKRAGTMCRPMKGKEENATDLTRGPHKGDLQDNVFESSDAAKKDFSGCICTNANTAKHVGCLVVLLADLCCQIHSADRLEACIVVFKCCSK